jgi:hypothetical protein
VNLIDTIATIVENWNLHHFPVRDRELYKRKRRSFKIMSSIVSDESTTMARDATIA